MFLTMAFKITSLNVNGLNSPQKRHMLWREACTQNCNVFCIQETHIKAQNHPSLAHSQYPHAYFACAPTKKRGVAILIKQTVTFQHISSQCDTDGRYIILSCKINNTAYTIVNAYVPNTRQISFLNKLWKKVKQHSSGHIILCGDLNAISNHQHHQHTEKALEQLYLTLPTQTIFMTCGDASIPPRRIIHSSLRSIYHIPG